MKENKWMAEFNDEDVWTDEEAFDTKEEAIEYGKQEAEAHDVLNFLVGQCVPYKLPEKLIDADDVIEDIQEMVHDHMGECSEVYLDDVEKEHRDELEQELNKVLKDWLKKYGYEPNMFKIVNIETIDV